MTNQVSKTEISPEFKAKVLKNHVGEDGRVNMFPSQEKKKMVLLEVLAARFLPAKEYSEKEVNELVKELTDDYASVRRYLIQYGFLQRTADGKTYWRAG